MKKFEEAFIPQFWADVDEFAMERAYWEEKAKRKPYDSIVQHSWPEDKPTEDKEYITRAIYDGQVYMEIDGFSSVTGQWAINEYTNVTHWWDLPKVMKR